MTKKQCPLIKINQWFDSWNMRDWSANDGPGEPPKEFYVGAMKIRTLRRLAGVDVRDIRKRKANSLAPGYQRGHDKERSETIARYIRYGYPLSTQKGLDPHEHKDLVNPGWLPTAILMNIIPRGGSREQDGKTIKIDDKRVLSIVETYGNCCLEYPANVDSDKTWKFGNNELQPLEIIDGQHRLFSVGPDEDTGDDYSVPVVFFNNLASQWQAYLFWVINVEPKRINTSLAFDLYPELRNSAWLERGEWIKVYQEHRAQELTEALWRHENSPWRDRIELFGNRIEGHVSNAAFIRSLTASFIRGWKAETDDNMSKIGGLFGSVDKAGKSYVIKWKRSQQAAFLIAMWNAVHQAVKKSSASWVLACRKADSNIGKDQNPHRLDPAFAGIHTLLGTDQGVRAVSVIYNAIFQIQHEKLGLSEWKSDAVGEPSTEVVSSALAEIQKRRAVLSFMDKVANELINGFDWRTSSEPSIQDGELKKVQGAYRGSSGYALLQRELMHVLAKAKDPEISKAASDVIKLLSWQKK